MRVQRFDPGTTRKVEHLPDGGIRVHAYVTSPGVYPYLQGDGTVVRELRPAEELFAARALESMRGIAVTDLHPPVLVSASNWREFARGHAENPRREGDYAAAELVVHEEESRTRVLTGERVEVSSGYTCEIDPTPGVHTDGKPYDRIQRGHIFNHFAIGPRDWGRLGPDVQMHLDAADAVQRCESESAHGARLRGTANAGDGEERAKMKTIRIDGVDYQVDDAAAPHLERVFAAINKDRDEQRSRAEGEKTRADKAEGELSVAKTRAEKAEGDLARATDPKRLDSLVRTRVQLERDAAKVIGCDEQGAEPTFDGLSDDDVRRRVILSVSPDQKLDGKSTDFLIGAYEATVRTHRQAAREATFDAGVEDVGDRRADPPLAQVRADAIGKRHARLNGAQEGK